MKLVIISVLIMGLALNGLSQNIESKSRKRNGIYTEAYLIRHDFSSGFASINYERNFGKKYRTHLRLGIYPDFRSTVSFPITFTWVTQPLGNHHFEYGLGAVGRVEHYVDPYSTTHKEWFFDVPAIMLPLMYRYQRSSGLYFRGGINLLLSWPSMVQPSLSIGITL